MRAEVDVARLREVMRALGSAANGPGRIYLTGGTSALLMGWRLATVDVDVRLDPEPKGVFEAIRTIKQRFDVNIELASPQDFIPELPGWRERSIYIDTFGRVSFYHYDFYAQALSKLERGHERDQLDVDAMIRHNLIEVEHLRALFAQIEPLLLRYPSLDPEDFRLKVERFLSSIDPDDAYDE